MAQSKTNVLADEDEKEIEAALETLVRPSNRLTPARKKAIETMAEQALYEEQQKIAVRISRNDLQRLKSRAAQEGVSYQTLIDSIIQKYLGS